MEGLSTKFVTKLCVSLNGHTKQFLLKHQLPHRDGIRVGLWETFYSDGQLESSLHYKDGQLDGLIQDFDQHGRVTYYEEYKDGQFVKAEATKI